MRFIRLCNVIAMGIAQPKSAVESVTGNLMPLIPMFKDERFYFKRIVLPPVALDVKTNRMIVIQAIIHH